MSSRPSGSGFCSVAVLRLSQRLGMQGDLRNLIAYAPNPLEGKPMLTADGDEFTP